MNLRGCLECNKLLISNDRVLLRGTCPEMHGKDGEKIPLNMQDCF